MNESLIIYDEQYQDIANVISQYHDIKTIFDVGCGEGQLLELLVSNGYIVSGSEIFEDNVKKLKSKGLNVVNTSITEMQNYPDKNFDCMILSNVLHHISQPQKALQNCFRLCRKLLIIAEAFADESIEFQKNTLQIDKKMKDYEQQQGYYHRHHYLAGEILGLCSPFSLGIKNYRVNTYLKLQPISNKELAEWIERTQDDIKKLALSQKGELCKFGLQLTLIDFS